MDLRLTPDDRVGATRRRRGGKKNTKSKSSGKTGRGRATTSKSRKRGGSGRSRARKPLTLGRVLGFLAYWSFVLALWGGIAAAAIVVYFAIQLPSSDSWAVPERPANIRIIATDGRLISNRGQMGGEAVALRELPHYVPAAIVAIEDRRFEQHFGVDPIGILGAMRINISEGRMPLDGHGGSTITQQVAKNLFLTPEQTIGRKIQEAVLAIWLEQNYTKEGILELYLNRVYFGAGAYGIEAAAQTYFGKSARNLSLGEASILAGVLKAPSALSPDTHPERAAARARLVLNAMAEEGYISSEEAVAAAIDPNRRIRTRVAGAEFYVADWVETLMQAYIGTVDEDVIVSTTIDWDLQKHAEFVVREVVAAEGEAHSFSQGALVAMDVEGSVKAIVGGTDYTESQYNRAVTARRQPGSAFKPMVYLTALEHGYTPETLVEDAPFTYNGWSPANYNNEYSGTVRLRDALARSLNTVAARLAIDVGPQNVVETAYRMGISPPLNPVPSVALGVNEVSLLDLTAAYAPFANGGIGVIAHVITRIETADGEVLYENIPSGPGRVVSSDHVAMMNSMLSDAVQVGTGRAARLDGWPIAGKTGTTQESRDAVFVGYTSRLIAGVWLGNDDSTPMQGVGGGSFPVQIWSDFMSRAHQGLSVTDLPGSYSSSPVFDGETSPNPDNRTLVDAINDLFGW